MKRNHIIFGDSPNNRRLFITREKTSQQEQNVPKQEQNVSHQEQKALKQIEATTSTDKSSTNGKVTYLTTADFKQR